MAYSQQVNDHFENPRNCGSFDAAEPGVATAMVGSPRAGEVIRLQLRLHADGVHIEEARFKAYGAAPAIAAASFVAQWLGGKSLEQALALGHADVSQALALQPSQLHSAILAQEAVRAAVAALSGGASREENSKP
ncbi:iron-sulfur cluster assembly scaffold protein [Comamonas sp. NLF-1-9]|uniref:iron-sulfur cluster assembly scaffold protein n=1 Tax=Comamonas sp. NLF-1-9 TaxID=2853163 RepID=UPI001C4748A3|nr:iron-sulfur cluster assembly scaffold protein [Comamonas sp. NLF-1-9]QXL85082.1 iron-sulfur cluster assembly scaffold protein [Comamonas sp. NLF-1-9]